MNNTLAAALIAGDKHSAPVTHIGQRILWTIVTLVVLAGIYVLMWRGWKKRQARQADIAPPLTEPPVGAEVGSADDSFDCVYVSTTSEGDWLDRIAVHDLGNRSNSDVFVGPGGVWIERETFGATSIFIPTAAIRGVRLTTGMAGKYLREEGIVVVTWSHGDRVLDTGVKTRLDADRDILVKSIEHIMNSPAGASARTGAQAEGTNE